MTGSRSQTRRAALLGMPLGMLCAMPLAMPLVGGALAAQEPGEPGWKTGVGLDELRETERAFVAELDRRWSAGRAEDLAALFDFLHPQAAYELRGRLAATRGDDPLERHSRILARHARPGFASLVLSVRLDAPEVARPEVAHSESRPRPAGSEPKARFFEILVLRVPARPGERLRGLSLLETSPDAQRRVEGREHGKLVRGLAIGAGQVFQCPVCNYRIGAPSDGDWLVVARPAFLSGCLEAVEVYSLRADLALEISVHAGLGDREGELATLLGRTAAGIAHLHGRACPALDPKPLRLDGATGLVASLEVDGGARAYRFLALRSGSVCYLLALQGRRELVGEGRPVAEALLATFGVVEPGLSGQEAKILAAHAGGGHFEASTFRLPRFALALHGPEGYETYQRAGATAFQAGWRCPKGNGSLVFAGLERPQAPWTGAALRAWLTSWVRGERNAPHPGGRFKVTGKTSTEEVAGLPATLLRFCYEMPPAVPGQAPAEAPSGRSCFLLLVRNGRLLYVLRGEARGSDAKGVLAALLASARSLELTKRG